MPEIARAWAFPSSGGTTQYEVLLLDDDTLSCSCPGWIFAKKEQKRGCKHTRIVENAIEYYGSVADVPDDIAALPAPAPRPPRYFQPRGEPIAIPKRPAPTSQIIDLKGERTIEF